MGVAEEGEVTVLVAEEEAEDDAEADALEVEVAVAVEVALGVGRLGFLARADKYRHPGGACTMGSYDKPAWSPFSVFFTI